MLDDNLSFEEKFIAFIDIIGFKNMVARAEEGKTIKEIEDLIKILKCTGFTENNICPESKRIREDLNLQIVQVSDCVVISIEISPAGIINLIEKSFNIVLGLLQKGHLCRGYISKGKIIYREGTFFGTGYQNTYEKEDKVTAFKQKVNEIGTPFVEIDSEVCKYVEDCGDKLVQTMFNRMVESDGIVKAIFPFKRLRHSFTIHNSLWYKPDHDKEKKSNDNMKKFINDIKKRIMENIDCKNPKAVNKGEHYIQLLNRQLDNCEQLDSMLEILEN